MSGIFDTNLFRETTVGVLGALPSGAEPVAALASYRGQFPSLPSASELASKGATHFSVQQASGKGGSAAFSFYNSGGDRISGPTTLYAGGAGPVSPSPSKGAPPAHREGDGLLPGSSVPAAPTRAEPKWLPWLLVGGGVAVAGGIIWTATRKKSVAKNRRRKRRRRRTSR